ncbi:hypothetical protein DB346_19690 [Verrucomicrobia bacterium LW23]|nr:hypothetical protein DB346_19690 [Verrucomicrobia bacterium LW23]
MLDTNGMELPDNAHALGANAPARRRRVWMFSGQGSQSYGMAKELFETEPAFRKAFLELASQVDTTSSDDHAGTPARSLEEILFSPPPRVSPAPGRPEAPAALSNTHHSNPALFVTQYAMAEMMLARGWRPDAVLGYSLGEFVAAAVAGVLTPLQALHIVQLIPRVMAASASRGSMAAVIASTELFTREPDLFAPCELAASNTARHFVISGPAEDIERIRMALKARSIQAIPLPIEYPFHSSFLEPVADKVRNLLQGIRLRRPSIPFYACRSGSRSDTFENDFVWRVTRDLVDFPGALAAAERDGPALYVDLGPSGTLASFSRQNLAAAQRNASSQRPASEALTILSPYGQDGHALAAAEKVLGAET